MMQRVSTGAGTRRKRALEFVDHPVDRRLRTSANGVRNMVGPFALGGRTHVKIRRARMRLLEFQIDPQQVRARMYVSQQLDRLLINMRGEIRRRGKTFGRQDYAGA